ncbi:MAG: hypothetical protein JWO11_2097 [Nocardioides sp.]|nr:hypothetical protein [Nocardioides sp.]
MIRGRGNHFPDEYPRQRNDSAHLFSVLDQGDLVANSKRVELLAKGRREIGHIEAQSHSMSMRCNQVQTRQRRRARTCRARSSACPRGVRHRPRLRSATGGD